MSDLTDWKYHSVTLSVFAEIQRRVSDLKDELAASAGKDPLYDRFRAGYLQACKDFLDIELEESHGN